MKKEKIMGTKRWIYWVSIGVVLILVYKFLDNFSGIGRWIGELFSVLIPFLLGIIIAFILYLPCSKIEKNLKKNKKLKHTRGMSITIVYITTFALLALIIKFIVPVLVDSVKDLIINVQSYYNAIKADELSSNIAPWLQENVLKPIVEYIQNIDFTSMFTPDKIKTYITSAVGAIRVIANIFISFICSIYILAQREQIVGFINKLARALMTKGGYDRFVRYFSKGNQIFLQYISGQVLDATVVAVLTSVAMSIIGVKYSLMLGVFIGISNLIPYFGAVVGVVIAVIITLLTGGFKQAVIMAIVVTILQQIDANIINPRITSSKLKVSPLLVMFAVMIGGSYFGVLGMLIAVPLITLLNIIIDEVLDERIEAKSQKTINKEDE